ncbi:hypothetical protein QL285_009651 [Trifolium repens]|nr:hypothetical protein QL285_009651 [Trifolium repens]
MSIERRVESFADDLNTRRGIVSGRVALLPRSTEIQPLSLRFVPPHPHVTYHTRRLQGLMENNWWAKFFTSPPACSPLVLPRLLYSSSRVLRNIVGTCNGVPEGKSYARPNA